MATSRKCPVCDRQVPLLKGGSGLRQKHYINETRGLFTGYELKVCKGHDPTHGATPSGRTMDETKKDGRILCRCCGKRVPETKRYLPQKHVDDLGRPCRGWRDNQG